MNSLRPDQSHVAQQIRRDKLRIQNSSQHFQEFPNDLEQLPLHPEFNLDLLQVRNVRNANMLDEPAVYSSETPSFSRNALEYQELLGAAEPSRLMMHQQYGSFPHSLADIHAPQKEQCELRDLGNWRNSGPHHISDWIANYASNSSTELNNADGYQHYEKPGHSEQFGIAYGEVAGREIQKQLGVNVMHQHHAPSPSSSPLYQNALQDIVKSASISGHGSDMASVLMQHTGQGIWVGDAGVLELQPSYASQPNHQLRFGWKNRSDSNPQSLSLSLSSNAQSKAYVSQFEEGSASDDIQSGCGVSKDLQCLKYMKPSIISKDCVKSLQDMVGIPSKAIYRNVGPLGPFTGYATILKSSRFLKTAQQLLDEFCCLSGPKSAKICGVISERLSREVSASTSADTETVNETGVASKGSNSSSSTSMLYISNGNSAYWGPGSSFGVSLRPDYQQKKAKLMYMQEEVTRQYKQYHQQMQMVVSSFESVAGLSSAAPYISLALKSVSKHFRCLNNSISDKLKLVSEVLGEDLSIPTSSTGGKGDTSMARLRCMGQILQKNTPGRGTATTGLLEAQQHVWRPQRGFPERSVAILRAWLFEHFLHPYPTDTDKHMLATQTGLSRNQVSNWFINARVRVWKPMVEEIHMLEAKATGGNGDPSKNEGTSGTEGGSNQARVDKPMYKFGMLHSIPENQFQGMELSSSIDANTEEAEQWSQEKRSKLECQMRSSMDGTVMGFLPYHRGEVEVGGLGTVSLTLGLRHGVEGVQQQQLQEEQLRHHLGGQMMIHDFVG